MIKNLMYIETECEKIFLLEQLFLFSSASTCYTCLLYSIFASHENRAYHY